LEKINKAQYFISLKCEENDGQNKNIEFSATLEELQDLVNKLKDASKSFQTIYQGWANLYKLFSLRFSNKFSFILRSTVSLFF